MIFGIFGWAILLCIMYEEWWAIPFLIFGVEASTGFAGSMVQWITTMGDD